MFSDNRKINLNLEPKPAVVPERWWQAQNQRENKQLKNGHLNLFFIQNVIFNFEALRLNKYESRCLTVEN